MKASFSAAIALACLCASTVVSTPIALDFTERAEHDLAILKRSLTDVNNFVALNYTHLVVGGGTTGLAVAVRLSEVSSNVVGVLEAGPSGLGDSINDIPGEFGGNLAGKYDWNYTTAAGSSGAPSIAWPRGFVLGGSSVLNFLVWDRAAKAEYDAWEELGSVGWNWDNMYKYMKKAEHFTTPSAANAKKLDITPVASDYGTSGPVQVSYPKYISQQVQRWIPALVSLGLTKNDEPLGGNNVGASVQPSDINPANSTRSASVNAYFVPASSRKNLKVLTSALATKVNFASSGNQQKATGVSFTTGGKSYTVKACEKVILSGGSVNTPALLELSGIGSQSVLSKAGVTQVIDLANVGENLQDHVYTSAAFELVQGTVTLDSLRNNATFAAEQQALYKANKASIFDETVPGIGYLTLPQLVGQGNATSLIQKASAYVKTQKGKAYYGTLQKQLDFLTKDSSSVSQMEVIGIDGYFSGAAAPAANTSYITFLAAQQHMLSRGTVHISSSSAAVHPIIQPNYFAADYDLDVLTAGTEYLRKIAATSNYTQNFITKEYVPGNVDVREYSLTKFVTEYHPIGTASMLPQNKGGVVDANLKVYGTSNLHVVDASVIPLHISAHIQATVYGVAEAAADILKGNSLK
ncbi:hypothetical protein CBS101457_005457 [Exobasidium rhododendri]|nr:hypothetical protein CBS101457_005457 [Exobasidium rhododendri]